MTGIITDTLEWFAIASVWVETYYIHTERTVGSCYLQEAAQIIKRILIAMHLPSRLHLKNCSEAELIMLWALLVPH